MLVARRAAGFVVRKSAGWALLRGFAVHVQARVRVQMRTRLKNGDCK